MFDPNEAGEAGEVHEDWGFFSYDPERKKIIFRQFLTKGFVNTYVLEEIGANGKTLTFTTESAEGAGGTRARLRFEIIGDDRYDLVLELAPPEKEFFRCRSLQMTRVK